LHHIEFTDEGFIVKNTDDIWNTDGNTFIYAAFAGSYSDYITNVNTEGTLESRVKASNTTGFSIVKYKGNNTDGATIGHGLSSALDFCVIKNLGPTARNWIVKHSALSGENSLFLNLPNSQSVTGAGNPTFDADTTITLNAGSASSLNINEADKEHIAYCWTEKAGVSKFGSYAGNATSVDLGFNPAFILIKRITTDAAWWIFDNTREVDGAFGDYIIANEAYGDQTVATAISVSGTTITFPNNWDSTHNGSSSSTYIYAAFADKREAAFWLDQSSNNNDFQPVNLDHNDTLLDSPTDNYCTLNPIELNYVTLSDGNLVVQETAGSWRCIRGNFMMTSGQWYWEFEATNSPSAYFGGGISRLDEPLNSYVGNTANGYGILGFNGNKYNTSGASSFSDTFFVGDVIGVAFDADIGTLDYYKNGIHLGTAYTGLDSGDFFPAFTVRSSTVKVNFGQEPFKYTPPE